jgi:uncharacterized protein YecT (DUF1311 family)
MRSKSVTALFLLSALSISGCTQSPPKLVVTCSSDDAVSTTANLVRDELDSDVTKKLKSSNNSPQISDSLIRATINQLTISISDIRTTKTDPNITKQFCTSNLLISFPMELLNNAEKARADTNISNLTSLSDETGVDRQANLFKSSFDYDVQPTDKGDKIFSESSDFGKFESFYAEALVSALLKSSIDQAQSAQQAAQNEQKIADRDQAKTENQLATQAINALWNDFPETLRQSLLEDQRAWIQKKKADCDVQAASSSTDPIVQETTRLKCDTAATQSRLQILQQHMNNPDTLPAT